MSHTLCGKDKLMKRVRRVRGQITTEMVERTLRVMMKVSSAAPSAKYTR